MGNKKPRKALCLGRYGVVWVCYMVRPQRNHQYELSFVDKGF